jgi:ribosomal protein L7/L12
MAGDKIKAIKIYREFYGVGMKEAQDAIERL